MVKSSSVLHPISVRIKTRMNSSAKELYKTTGLFIKERKVIMTKVSITKEQAATLRKEGIKTLVAVAVVSLLIGCTIGYFIGGGKLPEVPKSQKHAWVECNCPDSEYHYHCTTHGNGHECYDTITD